MSGFSIRKAKFYFPSPLLPLFDLDHVTLNQVLFICPKVSQLYICFYHVAAFHGLGRQENAFCYSTWNINKDRFFLSSTDFYHVYFVDCMVLSNEFSNQQLKTHYQIYLICKSRKGCIISDKLYDMKINR